MRTELNARIGRTTPSPLFGVLVAMGPAIPAQETGATRRRVHLPRELWMPALLLAALWPHWIYMARRTVDGSDEPWGVLALLTALVLLLRDHAHFVLPTRSALLAAATLAVVAAAAHLSLPDLAAAALAMLALGVYVMHALRRPATPMIVLLLLTLPLVASLQFYFGFPLRLLVAQVGAMLLATGGLEATASGAAIVHGSTIVLIDAPCAGIGMLWLGSYVAAVLSYLYGADALQTLVNGCVAAVLVFAANVARATALFFPEAGLVDWPAGTHEAVGLLAFCGAIVPLALFIGRRSR